MIDRNLRIAFGISLGVHIFVMSAVIIVTPEDIGRKKGYTRVDFLGPILEKTAFDIMLESANPVVKTSYSWGSLLSDGGNLKVPPPGRVAFGQEFPRWVENSMDGVVLEALAGHKSVPDFGLEIRVDSLKKKDLFQERKVIYTPEQPFVMGGLYGGQSSLPIKVKALVGPDGIVRKAEPATTTGYPHLDILATKFVRSWIFEPRKKSKDEWIVVEVMLEGPQ